MEAPRTKHASNIYPKSAHIVNGSVIYDDNVALKYAIWRYEEGKNETKNLLNVDSNELMAIWQQTKVSTNDRYNLFTVQKSKVTGEMSNFYVFLKQPSLFRSRTKRAKVPKWFGLFFHNKRRKSG